MSSRLELMRRQRAMLETLAQGGGEARLLGVDPGMLELLGRRHPENIRDALSVFLPVFLRCADLDDAAIRTSFATRPGTASAEVKLRLLVGCALGLKLGEPFAELIRLEAAAWRVKQAPQPLPEHVRSLRSGEPLGEVLELRTNVVDGWRYPDFDPRGCFVWGPPRKVYLWWDGGLRQRVFRDHGELALALALGAA